MGNPCKTCGTSDRDKSGHCKCCKREKNRLWREANHEAAKTASARWKAENKARTKDYDRQWNAENPGRRNAAISEWHKKNPEAHRLATLKRRARLKGDGGALSRDIAERLFKLQRGLCPCCHLPLGDNYHLDHIVPLARGGRNEDTNMQLLRQGCNVRKSAKHPVDFMQERGFLL